MTTQPSTITPARSPSPPPSPQRHPFALRVIIALFLLKAIGIIALVLIAYVLAPNLPSEITDELQVQLALLDAPVTIVTYLILAPLQLLAAYGLWRRKHWAWVLTMVLLAYSMTVDLINFMAGQPIYFSMTLNVIQVGYLNQREVQDLFGETNKSEPL